MAAVISPNTCMQTGAYAKLKTYLPCFISTVLWLFTFLMTLKIPLPSTVLLLLYLLSTCDKACLSLSFHRYVAIALNLLFYFRLATLWTINTKTKSANISLPVILLRHHFWFASKLYEDTNCVIEKTYFRCYICNCKYLFIIFFILIYDRGPWSNSCGDVGSVTAWVGRQYYVVRAR